MSLDLGATDIRYSADITSRWDEERGELIRTSNTFGVMVQDIIAVRARMEDDILRVAVIKELERLGYTVLSPED